jgi:choline kinase
VIAMSKYEAVILAAGRGSRLSEETGEIPKAILPIGPRTSRDATPTTFLRRQIEILEVLGVDKIAVVVGYLRDQVAAEIEKYAPKTRIVVNPTPEIQTSGSLHSFQFAARSKHGLLDGTRQTLLMDADIVYHEDALAKLLDAPERSMALVCDDFARTSEEVLVYGTVEKPVYLGKGLGDALVGNAPCLGEAVGIVKFAPADHTLVRQAMDWMLGDPSAKEGTLEFRGFGPARRATEHEELTQRLMQLGKLSCVLFSGDELPFMECDNGEEYAILRNELYPRVLSMPTRLR